jgi:toxin-antitoxin system PIN domain toxin
MKVVDLNVLLYAVNSSSAHHRIAKEWWEEALSSEETVGLAWIVLLGFLRLTTRRGIFDTPLSSEQALDRIQTWLEWPATRVVGEGEDHFRVLKMPPFRQFLRCSSVAKPASLLPCALNLVKNAIP